MAPRLGIARSFRVVLGRPESCARRTLRGSPLSAPGALSRLARAPLRPEDVDEFRQRFATWHHRQRPSASWSPRAQRSNRVLAVPEVIAAISGATPARPRRTRRVAPIANCPSRAVPRSCHRPGSAAPFTRTREPRPTALGGRAFSCDVLESSCERRALRADPSPRPRLERHLVARNSRRNRRRAHFRRPRLDRPDPLGLLSLFLTGCGHHPKTAVRGEHEMSVMDDFESGALTGWKAVGAGSGGWFIYTDGSKAPNPARSDPNVR
jgi:hypothetical protein